MKFLNYLLGALFLITAACSSSSNTNTAATPPPPKDIPKPPVATSTIRNSNSYNDGPVILFGDSLAKGFGSSSPENSLEGCLREASGLETINVAVNGDTSIDAMDALYATANMKASLVLVSVGGNDVMRDASLFREITELQTLNNTREIFRTFADAGSLVIHLGLNPPRNKVPRGVDPSRLPKIKTIADQEGVIFSEDSLKDLWGDWDYMHDIIHPNDEGYAIVCERIKAALAPHFKLQ